MRQQGTLTEWNDPRGFGFITPLDGGPRVFVHVSEFPRHQRRPTAMDEVAYSLGQDNRGRPRAFDVCLLGPRGPAWLEWAETTVSLRPTASFLMAILLLATLAFAAFSSLRPASGPERGREAQPVASQPSASDETLANAFRNRTSGVQVTGEGVVARVLPDDNDGSRHQRFILRLASGQTVLVAHNIDLAPRLNSLAPGDSVAFSGVYEWNPEGGVIHWTHRDPAGRHVAGWLQHQGATYQ